MSDSTWIATPRLRRISLARINDVVSANLGPTRVPGNAQPAAFNRQIAMYLAKHVSGWSTAVIGRFYNGRDHSTVCYALQRVEACGRAVLKLIAYSHTSKLSFSARTASLRICQCGLSALWLPGKRF